MLQLSLFFCSLTHLKDTDCHQNLISSSLYHPRPLHKMSSQSVYNLLSSVAYENRQNNATENITSFSRGDNHTEKCSTSLEHSHIWVSNVNFLSKSISLFHKDLLIILCSSRLYWAGSSGMFGERTADDGQISSCVYQGERAFWDTANLVLFHLRTDSPDRDLQEYLEKEQRAAAKYQAMPAKIREHYEELIKEETKRREDPEVS